MSSRHWIAGFALGLALFLPGLGQAQESQTGADQSAQNAQSESEAPSFPVRITEGKAEQKARERIQHEAAEREKADLIAQQGMDAATQRMAKFALWQTGLIAVGTVLLFLTLGLTWQANLAAQAAVKVTRDIGRVQTRAYLKITQARLFVDNPYKSLELVIKNNGQSPAKWFEIESSAQLVEAKTELRSHPRDQKRSKDRLFGDASEDIPIICEPDAGDEPLGRMVMRGCDESKFIIFQGVLRWETLFGECFESDFVFWQEVNPNFAAPPRNDMGPVDLNRPIFMRVYSGDQRAYEQVDCND